MKRLIFLLAVCCGVSSVFADVESSINELIPRLAATNVTERYSAWMELQDMASKSSRPGAEAEREELGKVLADKVEDEDVPQPAQMWMIRQLEYMGGEEAVNALTQAMRGSDAELRECARRALEKNRSTRATTSLRTALVEGGEASWEIGLINSLGQRRDPKAAAAITARLAKSETSAAAARALGRIATPEAIEALWKNIQVKAVADALIVAANARLTEKETSSAKAIFEKLYAADQPITVRAAALFGLTKADYAGAADKITEALSGSEPRLQNVAITAIVTANDPGTPAAIEQLWPKLGAGVRVKLLTSLNGLPEKLALEMASAEDANVRLAAIEALGRVGGAASVPVLFKAAGAEGQEKAAATAALGRLTDKNAVRAIENLARDGESSTRVMAINTLAARRNTAIIPNLLTYAQEPNPAIQEAALAAYGRIGGDSEVGLLGKLARMNATPNAMSALEAVCARVKNRPAAVDKILDALNLAQEKEVARFSTVFSLLGGNKGLVLVASMTESADPEVSNDAIRALSSWPDYPAAEKLLAIAGKSTAPENHYVLAMQGIARLARTAENEPAEKRADLVLAAMKITRTVAEKKLLLAALADVPHAKSVQAIKDLLTDADLKSDAALAGLGLAENLMKSDKTLAKDVAQAVETANVSPESTRRAQRLLRR
jgi:HEAT repeat protein